MPRNRSGRKSCTGRRISAGRPPVGRSLFAGERPCRSARSQAGLTLVEVIVATAVMVSILLGVLALLDSSNRLTKQETEVALTQQSARTGIYELARVVRQARAGQLFYANSVLPLANNSPGGTSFTDISGTRHYVRKGTDVLGVRGVLLGDRYTLTSGDVTCGAIVCDATQPLTVTVRSTSGNGVANFPSGGTPALAMKTRPFYFAVVYGTLQTVTVANTSFLVRSTTSGSWTQPAPGTRGQTTPSRSSWIRATRARAF